MICNKSFFKIKNILVVRKLNQVHKLDKMLKCYKDYIDN